MLRILGIGLGILLISLVACQKQVEFDKQELLETIIADYVMESYQEAVTAAKTLEQTLNQFTTTPDLVTLEAAQMAWKKSMTTWSIVEGLSFGPGRTSYRYLQLDNTPVRTVSIEAILADATPIDLAYVRQLSSYTKGLATIEYLLFGAGNSNATLQWYQSDPLAARRRAYLYYSSVHVLELLSAVEEEWENNYATTLASQTDNGSTGGIARFSNVLLHLSQTVARKKVGKPLGKESSTGAIQPSVVESPYAAYSWEIIHANLLGLQALFGTEKKGMGSYLAHLLGSERNTQKIAAQLEQLVALTANRSASLKTELTTQNAAVESIYEELKALYHLLEEDYLPYVSITLLANPDDGD